MSDEIKTVAPERPNPATIVFLELLIMEMLLGTSHSNLPPALVNDLAKIETRKARHITIDPQIQ